MTASVRARPTPAARAAGSTQRPNRPARAGSSRSRRAITKPTLPASLFGDERCPRRSPGRPFRPFDPGRIGHVGLVGQRRAERLGRIAEGSQPDIAHQAPLVAAYGADRHVRIHGPDILLRRRFGQHVRNGNRDATRPRPSVYPVATDSAEPHPYSSERAGRPGRWGRAGSAGPSRTSKEIDSCPPPPPPASTRAIRPGY